MQLAENRVVMVFVGSVRVLARPNDPMHNNGRQCAPLLFSARLVTNCLQCSCSCTIKSCKDTICKQTRSARTLCSQLPLGKIVFKVFQSFSYPKSFFKIVFRNRLHGQPRNNAQPCRAMASVASAYRSHTKPRCL